MKADHFLKNTLKYCIPSIVSAIIGIAVIPIISRIYPADDYGKINLFYTVGNMLLSIVLLGLDSAYIRFYYEGYSGLKRQEIFSLTFWNGVFLNLIVVGVSIFVFPNVVGRYLFGIKNTGLLIALGVYILGLVMFRLLSIDARMDQRAGVYNLQQVSLMLTNRVSFVLAAIVTTNYQASILTITASTILLALVFTIILKKPRDFRWKPIPVEAYKSIMQFAIPLMPTTVMLWLNNSVSKMVLSRYQDFSAVGILSIATSISNIFSVVPNAFCTYWSPFMYKNYNTEKEFIQKVHNYISVFSIFIIWCIYIFQDILYLIVGNEYTASQPYFMLIMLAPIQSLLCETTSYGIILKNKTKYNLYISGLAVLSNCVISYVLYPQYGAISAAIGIGAASIIQLVMKTLIGQRYYSSIVSTRTTIFGVLLILSLVITNVFIWDNIVARIIIAVIIASSCIGVYKNELRETIGYCHRLFLAILKQ